MSPPEKRQRTNGEGTETATANAAGRPRQLPPAHAPFHWGSQFDAHSPEVQSAWVSDGYIIVKGLLQPSEVRRLDDAIKADGGILSHSYGRDDGMGRVSRMSLWNHPGTDVTGMIARVPKVARTMEALLQGEVYHYHTKLMMKDAHTGGAHLWHQDFGYWCQNGFMYPDMGTVFIPLDKMDKENAGLQVLRCSNKLGLITHKRAGGQIEVEPQKLDWALQAGFEHVNLEMEPGDALFFHSLTLHTSGQNNSDRRRWCFLVAFCRADNPPLKQHHHPDYTPLQIATDDSILDPSVPLVDPTGKDFMDGKSNTSIKQYEEHGFH